MKPAKNQYFLSSIKISQRLIILFLTSVITFGLALPGLGIIAADQLAQQFHPITSAELTPAQTAFNLGMQRYQEETTTGFRAAVQHWEDALKLLEPRGEDQTQKTTLLNWLGLAYIKLGEIQKANQIYQQLLTLVQKTGDRYTEASTRLSLAGIYTKIGEYQKALEQYSLALPLWQAVKFQTGEAATLNSMGLIYADLGDYKNALDYYEKSLALAENLGNKNNIAAALNNIAQTYSNLGNWEKALEVYNQSLQIWQTSNDTAGQAATLNNIAFVYSSSGRLEEALNFYNQALPLWQKVGDRSGEASTLNNIGFVYANLGELKEALKFYNQALPRRQDVGDRPKEALTRYRIAQVERQQGNLEISLNQIETAIEIIEDLRTKVANQDLRTSFFASKQDYYEFYIDLLMELHQKSPEQGFDGKALQASERAKARSLLDILAESRGEITSGVDPQLLQQKRNLQDQLGTLEERRVQLLSSSHTEAQKQAINAEINTFLEQYKNLLGEIRATSPRYAALTQPQPLKLAEIQQLLDEETILLEYAIGLERSFFWVVTPTSLKSYILPPRKDLETAVKKYRDAILLPSQRLRRKLAEETGTALVKMILPEVEAFGEKRLLVVADGALQYIPFPSLPVQPPASPDDFSASLIEKHELVSLPSASTLGILRQEIKGRQPRDKILAVLADPVFSYEDERLPNSTEKKAEALPPDLARAARESGVLFDRLPYTLTEAEQILALVPSDEQTKEFGFEANREKAISPELSQYQIVHFATHGLLNSQNPQLSGLVLSLLDPTGKPLNGFLRLYDIFNLNLPAELVVLSACETGLGQQVRGEGLVGLTRGFMYAGAARVVVSLWSVDDQATASLMAEFYRGMLQDGLTPATALRTAQLKMSKNPDWRTPYYWAAFTLQGEWKK